MQKGGADAISRGYEGHAASQVRAYITRGNYVDIVKSRSKTPRAVLDAFRVDDVYEGVLTSSRTAQDFFWVYLYSPCV